MFNQVKTINFVPITKNPRWEKQIVPLLKILRDQKLQSREIIKIMTTFNEKYCWRRKDHRKKKSNYEQLMKLYQETLPQLCRDLASYLLSSEIRPIPMVMGQFKHRITYNKRELFYILVLMFFSLTPKQVSDKYEYEQKFHNYNNFNHILSNSSFKTQCIVEYLRKTVKDMLPGSKNQERFTIVRNVNENYLSIEKLLKEEKKMSKIQILGNNRSIEEFNGDIKIDFANRFIGGGCLKDGCVQEEIMFAVRPELLATTLLCQKMEDNQALAFIGFKRYFDWTGYSDKTKFDKPVQIEYQTTEKGQAMEYITAIDAIKYKIGRPDQFEKKLIDREIIKAFMGFSALQIDKKIVTGGWGCGVYNGDLQTKVLIQWIAASMAGKDIVICPFGRKEILLQHNMLQKLQKETIKSVYIRLISSASQKTDVKFNKLSIFSLMQEVFAKI